MTYNEIKKNIWFKEGISELDKADIDACISSIKEDFASETSNYEFVKKYGAVMLFDVFNKYFKENSVVFFVNHHLIVNLVSMFDRNGVNQKQDLKNIFTLQNLDSDFEINAQKNISIIKDKIKENENFNLTTSYDFLKKHLNDEMLSKDIFFEMNMMMKEVINTNLNKLVNKLKDRINFSQYNEEKKKEVIKTMLYYSYINEVIFITNKLRTNFMGHIIVNDFVENNLFNDYIRLLLSKSSYNKEDKNAIIVNNIFTIAPTGEEINKQQNNSPKFNFDDFDIAKYNREANNYLDMKYNTENIFTRLKKFFRIV